MSNQRGPENSVRGNAFEQVIADRYGGKKPKYKKGEKPPYDVIIPRGPGYPACRVEVKLDVSTYSKKRESGKIDYYPSRIHIIKKNHRDMKMDVDKNSDMAVYSFSMIPRHKDGTENHDMKNWPEAWIKWENLDRIAKNMELCGSSTNDCSKWTKKKKKRIRKYIMISLDKIFGDQVNYIWDEDEGILQPRIKQ
jgi:hypothetical protein